MPPLTGANTVYMWKQSSDGNTWTDLPISQITKAIVESLTSEAKLYFRLMSQSEKCTSEWSAAVVIWLLLLR